MSVRAAIHVHIINVSVMCVGKTSHGDLLFGQTHGEFKNEHWTDWPAAAAEGYARCIVSHAYLPACVRSCLACIYMRSPYKCTHMVLYTLRSVHTILQCTHHQLCFSLARVRARFDENNNCAYAARTFILLYRLSSSHIVKWLDVPVELAINVFNQFYNRLSYIDMDLWAIKIDI